MEEINEGSDKVDDVLLPGFRFHPTDEELVSFYLKRKIQQRPLSIELIKQLDIYKYDPWDLPKLASTGEKEWYFYCPRDRKYRNSARPNRVTEAGFWKATGTDRPIYSGGGAKCIGLKKSLVFYKGRAAKGVKTDWMMHEFRLPSLTDSASPKPSIDPKISANDSWAICRIFKKANTTAQRAVSSYSLGSSKPTTSSNIRAEDEFILNTDETALVQTKPFSDSPLFLSPVTDIHCNFTNGYNPFECFDGKLPQLLIPNETFNPSFMFQPMEESDLAKSAMDVSSILLNMSSSVLGGFGSPAAESFDQLGSSREPPADSFSPTLLQAMQGCTNYNEDDAMFGCVNVNIKHACEQWEAVSTVGQPMSCIWEKLLN